MIETETLAMSSEIRERQIEDSMTPSSISNDQNELEIIWYKKQLSDHFIESDVQHLHDAFNYLRLFDDPNECIDFITYPSRMDKSIYLIISDNDGLNLLSLTSELPQYRSMYFISKSSSISFPRCSRQSQWINETIKT